jgi:hypothetical protein
MTLRDGREASVKAQALLPRPRPLILQPQALTSFASRGRRQARIPSGRAERQRNIAVNNDVRQFESQNVLAKIDGRTIEGRTNT